MKISFWSFEAFIVFAVLIHSTECTISSWLKPVIATASGNGTFVKKINDGVTTGNNTGITISAVGTSITYKKVSQTPTSPVLAIDSTTGVVTVTSGTVSYTKSTALSIVVNANDGTNTETATVTINVNAAPTMSPHSSSVCIANASSKGVKLIDLIATDSNTGTFFTWAIASGNTKTDFAITSTGLVQVNTGKTLDKKTTASYTLVITAADNSSTPLTATTTVTASVQTTCSSSSIAVAISSMTLVAALAVAKSF